MTLNLSFRRREAACLVALASLGCTALLMHATAPPEATAYLNDGLFLSVRNYGLLLPLIAFGAVLTEVGPAAFIFSLIAFGAAVSVTVDGAESFFRSHDDTLTLLAAHPVGTIAMCSAIGIAMLLPVRLTKWYLPLAAATAGVALGLALQLESPGDDYTAWFTWSGTSARNCDCFHVDCRLDLLEIRFKRHMVWCRQPHSRQLAGHRELDVDWLGLRAEAGRGQRARRAFHNSGYRYAASALNNGERNSAKVLSARCVCYIILVATKLIGALHFVPA